VANKTKSYAEARLGEKATVLMVGNLPDLVQRVREVRVVRFVFVLTYFAQNIGSDLCLFEEAHSNLAGYDTQAIRVSLLEQLAIVAFLVGREIEVVLV
jgi:hypothetical protein